MANCQYIVVVDIWILLLTLIESFVVWNQSISSKLFIWIKYYADKKNFHQVVKLNSESPGHLNIWKEALTPNIINHISVGTKEVQQQKYHGRFYPLIHKYNQGAIIEFCHYIFCCLYRVHVSGIYPWMNTRKCGEILGALISLVINYYVKKL